MRRLIFIRHRVLRFTRSDLTGFQVLYRDRLLFGRIRVWRTEIDREDVPSWAFIAQACLGSTDWESRLFKEYAHLRPA
ncbi:hypothetical protein BBB39_16200 [Bordetella trematum]|uniref:Uncharacterized protein n=1 Tax=Bordetella trematum TaxID=123899 RepID=A0A157KWT3_9BORD|nr:hypothetical protein [Bordetella trematum]AZR95124.1 hypothetical protein BBB39_16200 [Bordetella trematum]NNH18673.1 hypothetical protein [Bordetella trematum]SAH88882.1 Uncharacterised protein [Bordetella trematum]SAI66563.1 Uncharacterised protein [Bordetella trematum]SUV96547.1 Uncharacterised protein [Bordetella trematum]